MPEKISFTTSDGVNIVADFYKSPESPNLNKTIVALHMMPADRASWRELAELAKADGFDFLAFDERGHGESTNSTDGRFLDYRSFNDADQRDKLKDLDAALEWLKLVRKTASENVLLVGASIGANLVLNYSALHPEITKTVALSPGLNYSGVATAEAVSQLTDKQAILLVASADDRPASEAVAKLSALGDVEKTVIEYPAGGHANHLFVAHPELAKTVLEFLE